MTGCKSVETESDYDCSHEGLSFAEVKASRAYRALVVKSEPDASPSA